MALLLSVLFTLNLLLCVFNLIPVPPLDGSGALGLLLAYRGLDLLVAFTARFTSRAVGIEIDGFHDAFLGPEDEGAVPRAKVAGEGDDGTVLLASMS